MEVAVVAPEIAEVRSLHVVWISQQEVAKTVTRICAKEGERSHGGAAGDERVGHVRQLPAELHVVLTGGVGNAVGVLPIADPVRLGARVGRRSGECGITGYGQVWKAGIGN